MNNLTLYIDCQKNHYEVDLLENSTFKPIPCSSWIKNNIQHKQPKQKVNRKDLIHSTEKENFTAQIKLSFKFF